MTGVTLRSRSATNTLVTDPYLVRVLETAYATREECLALIDLVSVYLQSLSETADKDTASVDAQLQLSKLQKRLYSRLSLLRGQNRTALLKVRETKQATAEARQEVDRLHLQLGNLYYEEKHSRGDVAACESYDHSYQQLPLIPPEQFLERFPEHSEDDEKTLMLARINHERVEREELEEQRQELLKRRKTLIAENEKSKDSLARLDKDLQIFMDGAKPIIKTFEKHTRTSETKVTD